MYDEVKREVAIGNRVLAHIGLATGITVSLGHVSRRVPEAPDHFVVKGRGYAVDALPAVRASQMVVCDLDANRIEAPPGATQCYEVMIHAGIYRARPEVQSVVHVHPRYAVLMSVLGEPLVPMCQEGSELVRTPVPLWPHSRLVVTREDGDGLASVMGASPVALLLGHGAVAAGGSIPEVIAAMYGLEEQARMNYLAVAVAGSGHRAVPEALLEEQDRSPGFYQLEHFARDLPAEQRDNPHRPVALGPYPFWASEVEAGVDD